MKKIKTGANDCVFPTKQDNVCDYNPQSVMSGGLILEGIIINLSMNNIEKIYD